MQISALRKSNHAGNGISDLWTLQFSNLLLLSSQKLTLVLSYHLFYYSAVENNGMILSTDQLTSDTDGGISDNGIELSTENVFAPKASLSKDEEEPSEELLFWLEKGKSRFVCVYQLVYMLFLRYKFLCGYQI